MLKIQELFYLWKIKVNLGCAAHPSTTSMHVKDKINK